MHGPLGVRFTQRSSRSNRPFRCDRTGRDIGTALAVDLASVVARPGSISSIPLASYLHSKLAEFAIYLLRALFTFVFICSHVASTAVKGVRSDAALRAYATTR